MQKAQSPLRIALVEDNPADVTLLRQALEEHGELFVLEVIRDGEAALDFVRSAWRATTPEPCLIVLDLHLPRCDGTKVLEALRSEPELAHLQVVVLTTMATPEERREALRLGVRAYRTKPMNWDDMVKLAGELIEFCKQPAPQAAAG